MDPNLAAANLAILLRWVTLRTGAAVRLTGADRTAYLTQGKGALSDQVAGFVVAAPYALMAADAQPLLQSALSEAEPWIRRHA